MKLSLYMFFCCISIVSLSGCDEEVTFVTENQVKVVSAEFVSSNEFKIVYMAHDDHIEKIQTNLFVQGSSDTRYSIDRCVDYGLAGSSPYKYEATFRVRPHFVQGDTVAVSNFDPEVGPTARFEVPAYYSPPPRRAAGNQVCSLALPNCVSKIRMDADFATT